MSTNANSSAIAANPFALMMNPEAVLTAMEHSDSLRSLKLRRIQPLDELPPLRKDAPAMATEKEIDEANFPLWRDLISSSDPNFIPQLFS
ncbi:hypothetical protein [Xylophilus sp. GOD-11R]|uniref:hypothetical protein n=1 Tax=Xylophilus sp. GOD-11R TaxID=3089814 RepID=UPI00298CD6D1|nr:hypothetical protein [Xylophilus sp. GOD-11R]WPB56495.1 hypothetical protein R9X41_20490 [Xylophilus sp. GOD-11R]